MVLGRRGFWHWVRATSFRKELEKAADPQPVEADFNRDYEPPKFKLKWDKPQINREMATDFILFAHSDLDKTKMLLDREPGLLNATMDWGNGDWETALGGASHMGRKDIAKMLIAREARVDIFAATMLAMVAAVKEMHSPSPAKSGFSLFYL